MSLYQRFLKTILHVGTRERERERGREREREMGDQKKRKRDGRSDRENKYNCRQ
jgi:hypothetical protein